MNEIIKDMPKLESPFIRKIINEQYVVTPEINPDYQWVFDGNEDEVACMEKLDGTNVSILIKDAIITGIWNRKNRIPFFNKTHIHIIQGILNSYGKGYCELPDGQHFGELIGHKLQKNPMKVDGHLWIPFMSFGMNRLVYKSWHKYPHNFEDISEWFMKPISEGGIFSLYARRRNIELQPEGVVFHNLKTGQMCKLRRDMFDWYKGRRHNGGKKDE